MDDARMTLLRLCVLFGEPNPDILRSRMSCRQYDEWLAYLRADGPQGFHRMDWLAASISWMVAEVNRASGAPSDLKTHLVQFGPAIPTPAMSEDEIRAELAKLR